LFDTDTKRRIDTVCDILVGKVPDPKSLVEQITIALIYKFMDVMDAEAQGIAFVKLEKSIRDKFRRDLSKLSQGEGLIALFAA
jgi:hypothetical protein